MIPDETIQEVLSRVDLVKLVGEQVRLRKAGVAYKGLCPFHDEKTPSFQVSPQNNRYHCFGCQASGDAIRWLMETQNLGFLEALRTLAGQVGVALPEKSPLKPEQRAAQAAQKTQLAHLAEVQDKICQYYSEELAQTPHAEAARRYLHARGIRPETARAFRLGWAEGHNQAFADFCAQAGIREEDLHALGLLAPVDPDRPQRPPYPGYRLRFYRRLVFPVINLKGEVTGFSGRIIDPHSKAPKYLNSPETLLFKKSEQLYGAHTAREGSRRAKRLVLCEGNLDVVSLWQAGFEGTVAPMGTALTSAQVLLCRRLSRQIICVMDGDAAGQKAAQASLPLFLQAGIQPRAVWLPAQDDPDTFLRREGADALRQRLDAAPALFDQVIEQVAERSPEDLLGRQQALRALAPNLAALDDQLAQQIYTAHIAARLQLPESIVRAAREEAQRELRVAPAARPEAPAAPAAPATPSHRSMPPAQAQPTAGPTLDPPSVPPPSLAVPEDAQAAQAADTLDLGPLDGLFLNTGGLVSAASAAPSLGPVKAPRHEEETIEFILQFPSLAQELGAAGAHKFLTDPRTAAFVASLCDELEQGRPPSIDALLAEQPDPHVVRFFRGLQARRPPTITEENRLAAFKQAMTRLEREYLVSMRRALLRRIERARVEQAQPEEINTLRSQLAELSRRIRDLQQPSGEGAV